MSNNPRRILESIERGLYTSNPINKKTHKHSSKAAKAKHKLRQINYEKKLRAYIGYLACQVSENSRFGRQKLIQWYKENKPLPILSVSSIVDTSEIQLKKDKMSYDEYRRQSPMAKFSEYMKYYRS